MFEEKDLVQGSPEWYKFRNYHLGASEIPAIMGTCDFRKPIDVFNDKVFGEKFEGNYATERGKQLEPIIIARFEEIKGCRLTQPTLEYKEWPTLSASLDGWIEAERAIVECKAPSRVKHIGVLCGFIPKTYEDQVQSQLLVANANINYYVSFSPDQEDGFDLAISEVLPNKERQNQILKCAKKMKEMIEAREWSDDYIKFVLDNAEVEPCRLFSKLEIKKEGLRSDQRRKRSTRPQPSLLENPFD